MKLNDKILYINNSSEKIKNPLVIENNLITAIDGNIKDKVQAIEYNVGIGDCIELLSIKVSDHKNAKSVSVYDINNRLWNEFCVMPNLNTLPFTNQHFPSKYTMKLSEGDRLSIFITPTGDVSDEPIFIEAKIRIYQYGSVPAEVFKNFDMFQGGMKSNAQYFERTVFDYELKDSDNKKWTEILNISLPGQGYSYFVKKIGVYPGEVRDKIHHSNKSYVMQAKISIDNNDLTVSGKSSKLCNYMKDSYTVTNFWVNTCDFLKPLKLEKPIKGIKNLNNSLSLKLLANIEKDESIKHICARLIGIKKNNFDLDDPVLIEKAKKFINN